MSWDDSQNLGSIAKDASEVVTQLTDIADYLKRIAVALEQVNKYGVSVDTPDRR